MSSDRPEASGASGPSGVIRTGVLPSGGRAKLPGDVDAALDEAGARLTLVTPERVIDGDVPGLAPSGGAAWWSTRDGSRAVLAGREGRAAIVVADAGAGIVRTVGVIPRSSSPAPVAPEYVRYADDGHGGVLVIFDIGVARIGEGGDLVWLVVHDDAEASPEEVTPRTATFASPNGAFTVGVDDGGVTLADGTPVLLVGAEGFGTVWVARRQARLFGIGRGGLQWTSPLAAVPDRATVSHAVAWMWHGEAVAGVRLADGAHLPGPVPCERCLWPVAPSALDELAFDEDRATRLLECRSCGALYEVDAWNERRSPLLLTHAEARAKYRGAV
jgi:hypothetical protein